MSLIPKNLRIFKIGELAMKIGFRPIEGEFGRDWLRRVDFLAREHFNTKVVFPGSMGLGKVSRDIEKLSLYEVARRDAEGLFSHKLLLYDAALRLNEGLGRKNRFADFLRGIKAPTHISAAKVGELIDASNYENVILLKSFHGVSGKPISFKDKDFLSLHSVLHHELGHSAIAAKKLEVPIFFKDRKLAIEEELRIAKEYGLEGRRTGKIPSWIPPVPHSQAMEELFVESGARSATLKLNNDPKKIKFRGYGITDETTRWFNAEIDFDSLVVENKLDELSRIKNKAFGESINPSSFMNTMAGAPLREVFGKNVPSDLYTGLNEIVKDGVRWAKHEKNTYGAIQGMLPDRPDFRGARTPGNPDSRRVIEEARRFFVGSSSVDVSSMNKAVHELADDVVDRAWKKIASVGDEVSELYSVAPVGVKRAIKIGGVVAVGIGAIALLRGMFEREYESQPVTFDAMQVINAKKDPSRYYPTKLK